MKPRTWAFWGIFGITLYLSLVTAATPSAEGTAIGRINFLMGAVTITRDGVALPPASVIIGCAIENGDQIKTSKDGSVELAIDKSTGSSAVIKIQANTSMIVETSTDNAVQSNSLFLLAGSLNLKVDKLSTNSRFQVQAGSAVMGVRGTEFEVGTAEDGELLLFTSEGSVVLETEDGEESLADAGKAIAYKRGAGMNVQNPGAADRPAFMRSWQEKKQQAFKARPEEGLRPLIVEYLAAHGQFMQAMAKFAKRQQMIREWAKDRKLPPKPDKLPVRPDMPKKPELDQIQQELAALRLMGIRVQELDQRLQRAEELLGTERFDAITLKDGKNLGVVINKVRQERADVDRKIAEVHFAAKIFAEKNGGVMPRQEIRPPKKPALPRP